MRAVTCPKYSDSSTPPPPTPLLPTLRVLLSHTYLAAIHRESAPPLSLTVMLFLTFSLLAIIAIANADPIRMSDAYVPNGGNGFAATESASIRPSHNARFTVLTDRVIRMEWRDDISRPFEDRPTLAVVHRDVPVPDFTQGISDDGVLTVTTSKVVLTYRVGLPFTSSTLRVSPRDGTAFTAWHFGMNGRRLFI